MKTRAYQRKNNDNTVIDINSGIQPKMTSNYSFAHYIRAGLAITSAVGMITLWRTTGFLSSSWQSDDIAPSNSLDTYQLITSRGGITFADNNLPFQPRYAKRAFGSEFRVNTYTTNQQKYPSVAGLITGDFVVTWHSDEQDGNYTGIYGQRYSSTGIPQGAEFQVNTYIKNEQKYPSVAGLTTEDFVVVWESYGQDGNYTGIYGQRYSSTGVPQGAELQVNTHINNEQKYPSVAGLSTGDFVVVWQSNEQDGDEYGIYGQRFSSTGVPQGSEFQINTYAMNDQERPSVASLSTGDFVVVWHSNGQDGGSGGIYGQRYLSTGIPQGSEFQINTYTTATQWYPSIAALSTGDFVVIWQSNGQDGDSFGIYGQRFSSTGVPQGSEFQINTYTTSEQSYLSVAGLSTGDFVVVWQSDGQDSDSYGIYGQRFSSTGIPQGSEFQINTYTTATQSYPSITALSMGDFVVVWDSNGQDGDSRGIYGQRFSNIGAPQGGEFQINTCTTAWQEFPSVAALSAGDFVVVWESYRQDGDGYGIYGRIYFTPVLINNGLTVLTVSELFNIDIGATNTTALSFDAIEITQVDPSLTINWNDTKTTIDTVTIPDIISGRKVEITSDGTNTNPTITTKTCKDGVCSEEKTTTLATAFSLDNGNGEQIPLGVKIGLFAGAGVLVASIGVFGGVCLCRHNKKEQSKREKTKAFRGRMKKFGLPDTVECSENPNAQTLIP